MKDEGHPPYQEVLFIDSSTGTKFLIGSTLQTDERDIFEGKEYPVCRVSISSASHPFYTKSKQIIDAEGRVDKFTKRYQIKREMETQKKEEKLKKEELAKKAVPVKKGKKK